GREGEENCIRGSLLLAAEYDVPVVATNDVRFVAKDDFQAHEARVCIHEGMMLEDPKRPRRYSEQQYLKTPQEMAAPVHDIPEALLNSVEIARRCSLELTLGKSVLPAYPTPDGSSVEDFLRDESVRGLAMRMEQLAQRPAAGRVITQNEYNDRLKIEL